MTSPGASLIRLLVAAVVAAVAWGGATGAGARPPLPDAAAELQAMRAELQPQLRTNAFGEPLVLSSRERPGRLEGDVYAEVAHPLAVVGRPFRTAAGLCEVMLLHLNVRACTPAATADGDGVSLLVGPKRTGSAGVQHRMSYTMRTEALDAAHLRVTLSAAQGPLSTHDYRMVFEAVPIDDGHSFVHFAYGYSHGTLARLAMGAYLATAGRSKIGFSVEGREPDGGPKYVRGERAAVERNVMRYYLALLAYSDAPEGTPEQRQQARWRSWFALTERHAAQLHEYGFDEYLKEKREDAVRAAGTK